MGRGKGGRRERGGGDRGRSKQMIVYTHTGRHSEPWGDTERKTQTHTWLLSHRHIWRHRKNHTHFSTQMAHA